MSRGPLEQIPDGWSGTTFVFPDERREDPEPVLSDDGGLGRPVTTGRTEAPRFRIFAALVRNDDRRLRHDSKIVKCALPCAISAIVMSMASVMPAFADDAADAKIAASLVKSFATLCVQSMTDLDRVERTAAALQWRRLQGAESKSFATPSPDATTKTWEVPRNADVPFFLSITHGMEDGKAVSACTIINSDVLPEPTKAAMIDILGLRHFFRTETEGTQDYVYWQVRPEGVSVIVALMNATAAGVKGINMSATLIGKKPAP